jgi:hypothetical protein
MRPAPLQLASPRRGQGPAAISYYGHWQALFTNVRYQDILRSL